MSDSLESKVRAAVEGALPDTGWTDSPVRYRPAVTEAVLALVRAETAKLGCGHETRYDDGYGCVVCILKRCVDQCDDSDCELPDDIANKVSRARRDALLAAAKAVCLECRDYSAAPTHFNGWHHAIGSMTSRCRAAAIHDLLAKEKL